MKIVPPAFYLSNVYHNYRGDVQRRIFELLWSVYKYYNADICDLTIYLESLIMKLTLAQHKEYLSHKLDINYLFSINKIVMSYMAHSSRIISHIDYTYIGDNTLSNAIKAYTNSNDKSLLHKLELTQLTSKLLMPQRYVKDEETVYKQITKTNVQKTSTNYKCSNCGKRDCYIAEVQIRSLDEGSNIIATCKNCHHRWTAA